VEWAGMEWDAVLYVSVTDISRLNELMKVGEFHMTRVDIRKMAGLLSNLPIDIKVSSDSTIEMI
jgi:hypothetical protein